MTDSIKDNKIAGAVVSSPYWFDKTYKGEDNLVSIVMSAYNSEKFVEESVTSIQTQTYSNWELLICDDCSTDSTWSILQNLAQSDSRIHLIRNEVNSGAGFSRNNCIKIARGRYIAFCDDGDLWEKNKLEKQLAFMKEKGTVLCYASYFRINKQGIGNKICLAPKKVTYKGMLRDDKIGFLTAIYDTKGLKGKVYMPLQRRRQDWAMLLRILKICRVCYGLQEPLARYRVLWRSISHNKFLLIKYNAKVYADTLHCSTFTSYLILLFWFLPNYSFKKLKYLLYNLWRI